MTSKKMTVSELTNIVQTQGIALNQMRADMQTFFKNIENSMLNTSAVNEEVKQEVKVNKVDIAENVRMTSAMKAEQRRAAQPAKRERKQIKRTSKQELRITELDNGDIAIVLPASVLAEYMDEDNEKVYVNDNGIFYATKYHAPRGSVEDVIAEGDGNLYFKLTFHTKK